jgi:acyl-CoA synthetase (NDP forming)
MYQEYDFEAPRSGLATNPDEAAKTAADIGFPVALKIASPDILHKTDVGGVALNQESPDAVRQAFDRIMASVRAAHPEASIEGVEVQEMISGGVEVIVGMLRSPGGR